MSCLSNARDMKISWSFLWNACILIIDDWLCNCACDHVIYEFLATKGAAPGAPMCGVRQSVIAHMQIHLPPFKCQLFHLFIVYQIPTLYMYCKLVQWTPVQ